MNARGPATASSPDPFREDAGIFKALFPNPVRSGSAGTILILDRGSTGYIRYEIYLYRLLQERGFNLVCVGWRQQDVARYYELLDIPYHYWDEFTPYADANDVRARFGGLNAADAIQRIEIDGVRVGLHALAECLRADYLEHRRGRVPDVFGVPEGIEPFLIRGLQAIGAGKAILERFHPESVIFGDALYTLQGALWDLCLSQAVDAIQISPALEDSTLYLKRGTAENRDWPYTFLSTAVWTQVLAAGPWTGALSAAFHERYRLGYRSGGWCSLQAITKNTREWTAQETRTALGMDGSRPVAVLFPHLVWDTPVYGQNLFPDHASWLAAVMQAAIQNTHVQWIVKLHPANEFSTQNEDFKANSRFAELALIANAIGDLPSHVHVLMPDAPINAYSLLAMADYCLTETGTIGIEGAAMGVTVLLGGRAHYAGKGFTIEPRSPEDYLDMVRRLHELPPISPAARALAERYAHASFHLKPFRFRSMAVEFPDATNAGIRIDVHVDSGAALADAPDMNDLLDWLTTSSAKDYLGPDLQRFVNRDLAADATSLR